MAKPMDIPCSDPEALLELLREERARAAAAERGYKAQVAALQAKAAADALAYARLAAASQDAQAAMQERLERQQKDHERELAQQAALFEERIKNLIETVNRAQAAKFGSKSEKVDPRQLSLFNDMEAVFEGSAPKPSTPFKPKAKKRSGRRRLPDTSKLPRNHIYHAPSGEPAGCPQCGSGLRVMKERIREVVRYEPARFVCDVHHMPVLVCPHCSKDHAKDPSRAPVILKASMPRLPLEKSFAHPSLIAAVINAKYVNAMPLYRIEEDFASIDENMRISRQTMAGWVIKSWRMWLSQVYGHMKEALLGSDLLGADETRVQVLKEPGRKPEKMSYMWLFARPPQAGYPLHLFHYNPSRGRDVITSFLRGWSGTLMSDCYGAYFHIAGVDNLACLVHIRREFINVISGLEKEDLQKVGSVASRAVDLLTDIMHTDNGFDGMTPQARTEARQALLRPKLDEFRRFAQVNVGYTAPRSRIRAAFDNALKHWEEVEHVCDDGRFPLDNNFCERAIRPFAVGRKNWLFSDTQLGAEASAGIYSIVSTARANGVKPREYIEWLLTKLPNIDGPIDSACLERLMPWSEALPKECLADPQEPRIAPDDPFIDVDPHIFDEIR